MPRSPAPTIEARILSALRRWGPQTVAQLHGPGTPGLTGRRAAEIREACWRLVERGEILSCPWDARWSYESAVYSLPTVPADNPGNGKEAPCRSDEMPSRL
jgi:hypothetical protein